MNHQENPENSVPEDENDTSPSNTNAAGIQADEPIQSDAGDKSQQRTKKKSRKIVFLLLILLITTASWYGYKLLNPDISGPRINPLNLIPENAIFVLETDKPYTAWSKLSKTELWSILQKDKDWESYGTQLKEIETTLSSFDQALDLFTNRTIYLSGHSYRKGEVGYLFILDLGGLSALTTWMTYSENVTKRTFMEQTIYEQFDPNTKKTLYFAFEDDMLIGSYVHVLVEASIREKEKATLSRSLDFIDIQKNVMGEGLIRMYLNYQALYPFMAQLIDKEDADAITEGLPFLFSGFYFDVDKESMLLEGFSNFQETLLTYLTLFPQAGTGGMDIANVAPDNTSLYFSLGFDSFAEFYTALNEKLSTDPSLGEEYQAYTKKTEKFLDISLKEDFAAWIDDEVAVIQIESEAQPSELALIFKAKSASLATEKMDYLSSQIKRKTPVKFKAVDYKGYLINYMSVKGFFNLMLGNLFKRFDRPYYTIIDEYVVFSNKPQVLRRIIDDYEAERTLASLPSFKEFQNKLRPNHSALLYLQLPALEKSENGLIDDQTIKFIQSRNSILSHFPQLAFKIIPSGKMFQTKLLLSINGADPSALGEYDLPSPEAINYDSIWQIDPGEQIEIAEIEIADFAAKKQSEEYDEGIPKYEVETKDGLRHGSYFEYHPTGELKIKGKYKDDLKEGIWKYYDESGDLTKKEKYRRGEVVK